MLSMKLYSFVTISKHVLYMFAYELLLQIVAAIIVQKNVIYMAVFCISWLV